MDKTYRDEYSRLFVVDQMPGSFSPADPHLQIYDNYISDTRLRFRRIRIPGRQEWTRTLQQRVPADGHLKVSEIFLDDAEYQALGSYDGHEIRKNRYFAEHDDVTLICDLYLGRLAGLKTVKIEFASAADRDSFVFEHSAIEVSGMDFFDGANLYDKDFAAVELELEGVVKRIHGVHLPIAETQD